MTRRADPFFYLFLAIPGLLVGAGLAVGCGLLLFDSWNEEDPFREYVVLEDTIEWAAWRRSAAAEGPAWFLQLRLAKDDRGFLVAASDLTDAFWEQVDAGEREDRRRISVLEGRGATVLIDSSFQAGTRSATPYMSRLQVGERMLVSLTKGNIDAETPWKRTTRILLLGVGLLVGLALLGASLHHVSVCVQHWRRTA